MQLIVLKSKIHRATVTEACLDYEGSLTIDETLMKAVNIRPFEKVEVYNLSNGNRFETYAIAGEADSGTICVNGAAAHLAQKGDMIIIAAYAVIVDNGEILKHKVKIIQLDEKNRARKNSTSGI